MGSTSESERFFVQLRYPHATDWVTVAVADTRRSAAAYAGAAFLNATDEAGQQAIEVRIMLEARLRADSGSSAVDEALASIARHQAEPPN